MNRITRTLSVAALFLLALTAWPRPVMAQDEHSEPSAPTSHETVSGEHESDAGLESAHELAVHEPPSWYGSVITGVIVLFVLAATLGSIAVLSKGPEPEDVTTGHDDHDHGHGH